MPETLRKRPLPISTSVVVIYAYRLELNCAWLLRLVGYMAPRAARDSCGVAYALSRRFYSHTRNGGLNWYLSSGLSILVGFSFQDEDIDVARSAPQGS